MTEPTPPTIEPTPPAAEPTPPTAAPTPPAVGWTAPEPTPGPAPGVEFADPGPRLIGYIIDILINAGIVLALVVIGVILAAVLPILAILPFLGVVIIPFIYFPYFWAKDGQTPGMKQMGIKVVRDVDGGPLSAGQAILRLIGYWISGFVFYLGYIWILIDKRRRGWFDLIAGTVVVKA
jgi:uncharacterized RDD family membrane protein YckC